MASKAGAGIYWDSECHRRGHLTGSATVPVAVFGVPPKKPLDHSLPPSKDFFGPTTFFVAPSRKFGHTRIKLVSTLRFCYDKFRQMPPKLKNGKKSAGSPVTDYRHAAKRKNIPPAGLAASGEIKEAPKLQFAYNPHLPPKLRSDPTGKADARYFVGNIFPAKNGKRNLRVVRRVQFKRLKPDRFAPDFPAFLLCSLRSFVAKKPIPAPPISAFSLQLSAFSSEQGSVNDIVLFY